MDLPTYLTRDEAAGVLNCHPDSVTTMLHDQTIPPRFVYWVGKQPRIHPAALDPLLHPDELRPHPQTHSLIAAIDRISRNMEAELAELRRLRELAQEGIQWPTKSYAPSIGD